MSQMSRDFGQAQETVAAGHPDVTSLSKAVITSEDNLPTVLVRIQSATHVMIREIPE